MLTKYQFWFEHFVLVIIPFLFYFLQKLREVKGVTQRFYSPQSRKNKARSCLNLKKQELSLGKTEEGNWF